MGCFPSKPSSQSSPAPQTMKLHQLIRPEKYKGGNRPSFAAAYARAARRYGFETGRNAGFAKRNNVVVKVKGRHHKDTAHEVPAQGIQNGSEFVVPVKIGTPGVTLNLDFDTGSSDLWVWSSALSQASSGHNIYDPHKSSTAKKAAGTWNITYGDGSSASGNVYTDIVTVADIAIEGQAVELAEKVSSSFLQDSGNDGLLGLAWPSLNMVQPQPVATPVENMINQNLINPPVFTVKLSRDDEGSFYSFGYIDPSVTSNPITYTDVDNSQGFWQVQSKTWTINGQTMENPGGTAILDTGTTLMLVPDEMVEAIYSSIEGSVYDDQQGGYKYPSDATIPDVAFAIGNNLYKLNSQDFGFDDLGDGYTVGGIQSCGTLPFSIFGDTMLKSLYVVFNQGDQTVGIAQRD
ncbi:aspartic peptidase domain-containing protein, partial [Trametes punicea]